MLEPNIESNNEHSRALKKTVAARWSGWRGVSGVFCDRRIPAEKKGKVYKTVVRAAMLYV